MRTHYTVNGADVTIEKNAAGYAVTVAKIYKDSKREVTKLSRRTIEDARKAAHYYAERM